MASVNDPHRILRNLFFVAVFHILLIKSCAINTASRSEGEQFALDAGLLRVRYKDVTESALDRPYFDDVGPRNITAIVGQTAILFCKVKYPGDRTVSWMRKRDLHILTSNVFTYTGDSRFSAIHPEHTDDWNLQIDYVQKKDAGVYECQVNTEPKINMAFLLNVEDAQAVIWGPTDVYVKRGSTISLTCAVNVQSAGSVLWYQGSRLVDFDSQRGGISLETERSDSSTTSRLLITRATLQDTGNYTCMPSNARPASVYVHVLNGENPAAMQRSIGNSRQSASALLLVIMTVHLLIGR